MKIRQRVVRAVGVLTVTASVTMLAACGSSGSSDDSGANAAPVDPELAPLVSVAKEEGELTWYGAIPDVSMKSLSEDFEKTYGIKVGYVKIASSDLSTRFSSEEAAGNHRADVVVAGQGPFQPRALADGLLTSVGNAGIPTFPPAGYDKKFWGNGDTPAVSIPLRGIAYNTDVIQGDDIPESWEDLIQPEYKGKLAINDPAEDRSVADFYNLLLKKYGEEFLVGLKNNAKQTYASANPMIQAIGAGEASVSGPTTEVTVINLRDQGAPIDVATPAFTSGSPQLLGLSANAPHPNAAKLMAHYLLSERAAEILTEGGGVVSPFGLGETKIPAEYEETPVSTPAESAEILRIFGD